MNLARIHFVSTGIKRNIFMNEKYQKGLEKQRLSLLWPLRSKLSKVILTIYKYILSSRRLGCIGYILEINKNS